MSIFFESQTTFSLNHFRFKRFPGAEAEKYLKEDKDCSRYLDELKDTSIGEVVIDPSNDKLVGYVFVNIKKDKGFIFNLEVNKDYRRKGLGTRLLKDAISKYGGMDLVVKKDNTAALKLYKKFGFTITGDGNTSEEYYMIKK